MSVNNGNISHPTLDARSLSLADAVGCGVVTSNSALMCYMCIYIHIRVFVVVCVCQHVRVIMHRVRGE